MYPAEGKIDLQYGKLFVFFQPILRTIPYKEKENIQKLL